MICKLNSIAVTPETARAREAQEREGGEGGEGGGGLGESGLYYVDTGQEYWTYKHC